MLPRLLALDLDGTLLPASKELTPRAVRAVGAARDAGTTVVIATGKALHLTERYASELGISGPLIAHDGGLVRDGGADRVLARITLPPGLAAGLSDRLRDLPLAPFLVDGADRLLLHEELEDWGWFLAAYASRSTLDPDPAAAAEGDPFFISWLGDADAVRRGEERVRSATGESFHVFSVEFHRHEIAMLVVRPRTNKGEGLRLVAHHLGIDRTDVTAIGDWLNDVDMLRWAGTGIAMAGSALQAREAADVVLPLSCEEDGVAAWLEETLGL